MGNYRKNQVLKFIWLTITLLASCVPTFAQVEQSTGESEEASRLVDKPLNAVYFLSLDKPGIVKRIRYYAGNEIYIKLKKDKKLHNLTIINVGNGYIETFDKKILIEQVKSIRVYRKNLLTKIGKALPWAGLGYFGADMINPIFSGREAFVVTRGTVTVAGSLIVSGILIKLLSKRTYKLGKNRYIKTIEIF